MSIVNPLPPLIPDSPGSGVKIIPIAPGTPLPAVTDTGTAPAATGNTTWYQDLGNSFQSGLSNAENNLIDFATKAGVNIMFVLIGLILLNAITNGAVADTAGKIKNAN